MYDHGDAPREACGVFGIYARPAAEPTVDAAR
jgi:hypothetical protein